MSKYFNVQVDKPHFRSVIDKVYDQFKRRFYKKQCGTPEYLPELFVNMIEVGKQAQLDNIMDRMASH